MKFEPVAGTNIDQACKNAMAIAKKNRRVVNFSFNGKQLVAKPNTKTWTSIRDEWNFLTFGKRRVKKYRVIPRTAKEALERWDKGDSVFTVEMGGLGPGYEQTIHILVYEIIRAQGDAPPPEDNSNGWWSDWMHDVICNCKLGTSGAQAGAAKNLAYHYIRDGYAKTIKKTPPDRHIQVSKEWPRLQNGNDETTQESKSARHE